MSRPGAIRPWTSCGRALSLSTSRIELQKAEKTLAAARHSLAAVWGGRAAAFEEVAGDLDEVVAAGAAGGRRGCDCRESRRGPLGNAGARQRAVLNLEKANGVPDVTVGGGVQRFEETDDSALVLGLGVPIPLFDRNQGGIREAVAELGKTRRQYEAAQVRTLAALSEAVSALAAAYDEVTILRNDVLPKAEQAFAAARGGLSSRASSTISTCWTPSGLCSRRRPVHRRGRGLSQGTGGCPASCRGTFDGCFEPIFTGGLE